MRDRAIQHVREALQTGTDAAQHPPQVVAYYERALAEFDRICSTLARLTVDYAELAERHGVLREMAYSS